MTDYSHHVIKFGLDGRRPYLTVQKKPMQWQDHMAYAVCFAVSAYVVNRSADLFLLAGVFALVAGLAISRAVETAAETGGDD